ncbi:MAG: alkaline phosphatase family protein [Candidatus Aquilonibacter sp.]|jgi:phospholipase C
MKSLKRSHFIAGLAGAAALPYVEWVRPALAQAAPAKLSDIEHFVILMQENRSFDHYFGTLSGVRGYSDPMAGILLNGNTVFHQPDGENSAGYVLPFRLDTKTTSAQRLHDLSHSWNALHASWNRGRLDGFVSAHRATNDGSGPLTMGYYTRDDLPFYYALADAFTICDGFFCSVMGPTYPNRYFWMSATNDPNGNHGGPAIKNLTTRYTWETYPERLQRAGVSWRIYHDDPEPNEPVGLNVILNFAPFQDAKNSPTSPLYEYAVKTRGVDQMLDDMRTGNLPQVSWIIPPYTMCEHPDELPAAGENYVRQIVEALMSNPTTWAKTAFIINYDENDGLFDHVLPPTPPVGTPDEYINGQPTGLGFRVPALIVSPFTRGGYVCGDTFDHTSTLRLLETRYGVEVPNLSAWRRKTCGDLTSAFGFGQPPDTSAPQFPQTASDLIVIEKQILTLPTPSVPTVQTMPQQEPGSRKRRGKNVAFTLQ